MGFEVVIGILLVAVIFVVFFTNLGADYTKKTNQQLLELWSFHERNVRTAKAVSPHAYQKAVEKMARLTSEMKKRGMLNEDATQEDDVLDAISRKHFFRGLDEIKAGAKSKEPIPLYQLGMVLRAAKELETSVKYLAAAADLGHTDAQYALAWACMTGSGVDQDGRQALKWFGIAALLGHDDARNALDVALKSFSTEEAKGVFAEAESWVAAFKRRSEPTPDGAAPSKVGGQSYVEGLPELEQLAANGDVQAQVRLGEMFYAGKKLPSDYQKAARLFLSAAEHGNADAQLYLGTMCENGHGMPRDLVKSMDWYVKAAAGGNGTAQLILAAKAVN